MPTDAFVNDFMGLRTCDKTDAVSLTHLGQTVLRFQEPEQEPNFSNTCSAGATESNASAPAPDKDMRVSDTSAHRAPAKEPDWKIRFSNTTEHSAFVNDLMGLRTCDKTDAGLLTHLRHTVLRFQEPEQEPCFSNTPTALCTSVDELDFSERSHDAGTLNSAHEPGTAPGTSSARSATVSGT